MSEANTCRLMCVLPVVCVAALAMGVSPALGAFPGQNGKIVFDSDRDGGDSDVWSMRPDGSKPVNLTANAASDEWRASWRADGRKIVFMSDRETPSNPTPPGFPGPDYEIFVMNADGSQTDADHRQRSRRRGTRVVARRQGDRVPDGFRRARAGRLGHVTIRANGTRERNLTNSPGVLDVDPDWSPNGRRIAFVSDRDGDDEVYTMKPDGSRVRQLTANDGSADGGPSWSPDGRKIAFDSDRDAVEETPVQVEIYTMAADGGDQTRLTFDDLSDFLPSWSPDGRKIAFSSFRDATEEDFNSEIYTMRADGSHLANLTQRPGVRCRLGLAAVTCRDV